MPLLLQQIIIAILVFGAAIYLARAFWRTMSGKYQGSCCGKKSSPRMDEMNKRIENSGKGKRVKL